MSESPSALILCGGLGTRLRSVTGELPKALAPIDGTPFIDYLIRYLVEQGIEYVVLCTGYEAGRIAEHCGDGSQWGITIDASPEAEPLGTAGAIKHAERFVQGRTFLVVNGDSFVNADLRAMLREHHECNTKITMAIAQVDDTSRFGAVLSDAAGNVIGFAEKGRSGAGAINAGIYLMDRDVLASIRAGASVSLEREILPRYVGRGLRAFPAAGPFIDIGTPESFALAPQILSREARESHGS